MVSYGWILDMGVGGSHFINYECLITELGNKWQWPRERDLTPPNFRGFHCEIESCLQHVAQVAGGGLSCETHME